MSTMCYMDEAESGQWRGSDVGSVLHSLSPQAEGVEQRYLYSL